MATVAEPVRRQERGFKLKDLAGIASTIAVLPPGQRLHVTGVNWEAYQFLLRTRDEAGCRAVQITYDRGEVEIMTTSSTHEYLKTLMGILIEQMAISRRMRFMGCGQLTISREDLERGFEPDECYYFDDAVPPIKSILESRVLQFDRDLARFLAMAPAADFGTIGHEFLDYLGTLTIAR